MNFTKAWKKFALIILFFGVIFGIAIYNGSNIFSLAKNTAYSFLHTHTFDSETFEESFNSGFNGRLSWVDANSMIVRAMDQKISNGVIKGDNGKLNFLWATEYIFAESAENENLSKAIDILKHAQNKGAKTLYVQRPWAISKLPYGYDFEYNEQYDYWCEKIAQEDIPVLDFRESLADKIDFYVTDHHWTVESSFYGAENIVNALCDLYELELDPANKYFDLNNYTSILYPHAFLGAEGIRTGRYFAGKDDFEVFVPDFETDFSFTQLAEHEPYFSIEGSFAKAFIDWDKLEDESYNNKYAAMSYNAYNENIVLNNMSDNDLKVMLIADSYARPMLPFLSLCFKEVRYLDPQEGRYNDSYVDYIDAYDPDIVIMMFPGEGEFVEE